MGLNKTEGVLSSIVEILKHIDSVQQEILVLSERSVVSFHSFLEDNKLQPDEKTLQGFQYHDIISQQIDAVNEAVNMIEQNINIYLHAIREDQSMLGQSIDKLSSRLMKSLQIAREKQEAFSGNAIDDKRGEEIQFF